MGDTMQQRLTQDLTQFLASLPEDDHLQYLNVLGTIAVPNKFTLPSLNSIFAPILYCQLSFLVHRYR